MRTLLWFLALGCGSGGGRDDDVDVSREGEADEADASDTDCVPRGWGRDEDGDGLASATEPQVEACESPGEGWTQYFGDCDDTDPKRNLNEVCDPDDVDEDCDGFADEYDMGGAGNTITWYYDRDGDGWGVETHTIGACVQPPGYAASSGDCRDGDPTKYPGAPEVCAYDAIDEDCDRSPPWYVDEDGDNYGADTVVSCDQPRAEASGDCDDADPALSPGAAEICADGIDQDCDGNAGRCGVQGVWDGWTHRPRVDGAYVSSGDLDGDGAIDLLVTVDESTVLAHPGPFDRAASRTAAEAILVVSPSTDRRFRWPARLADVDGDGRDDLVASEYTRDSENRVWIDVDAKAGAADGGNAEVFFSDAYPAGAEIDSDGDGAAEIGLVATDGVHFVEDPPLGTWSPADHDGAWLPGAWLVEDLGDTDGDGLPDLAWSEGGEVHVAYGPLVSEIGADVVISGGGTPVAAGDLDGDGLADLATGLGEARVRDHCGETPEGTVAIDLAPFEADVGLADASFTAGDIGRVAGAGDLDGDGSGELFVDTATYCDTDAGEAWVLTGPYAGALSAGSALAEIEWPTPVPLIGATAALTADLDADGGDDLVVSTFEHSLLFFGGPGI